ncbi:MAG: HAD family phosphatase [Mailhella sp.]|nr:HAD family phosphatase [Mailhella sp.]
MRYRLLCTDLDGTLLTGKKTITAWTRNVLIKKQEQGLVLALASGRTVPGIWPSARELELGCHGGYILAFNGGRIVECSTGLTIRNTCIPDGAVKELNCFAREYGCDLLTYGEDFVITNGMNNPWLNYEARCNDLAMKTTDDFSELAGHPLNKCLIAGQPEIIADLEVKAASAFGEKMAFFRSEPFFLECMPLGVDKGSSLAFLAERLELSLVETIAFGDGYNDIAMIKRAGLGVAMANAGEQVREAADYVAGSNDEDGLAEAVEHFVW